MPLNQIVEQAIRASTPEETPAGSAEHAAAAITRPNTANSLDPQDWGEMRAQAHRMLDDILDYQQNIRQRPVWQPVPQAVRASFQQALPRQSAELGDVHDVFMEDILPYAIGNAHPGFMGWVHGAGTPVGMLAEMLAAGLNANLGGREQIPVEVERQVTRWMCELFSFPESASGLFVTGTSMANLIALLVARAKALGAEVRRQGLFSNGVQLTAYASAGAHKCIYKAMEVAGIGSDFLRVIPMTERFQMDVVALERAIAEDRAAGRQPFFIAGTAGSVDVGAIDPLQQLAEIAQREGLWFHVDVNKLIVYTLISFEITLMELYKILHSFVDVSQNVCTFLLVFTSQVFKNKFSLSCLAFISTIIG